MNGLALIIVILLGIWVASVQVEVRNIKPFWAYFWCIVIGPLWGWIAIALTCSRKSPNQ